MTPIKLKVLPFLLVGLIILLNPSSTCLAQEDIKFKIESLSIISDLGEDLSDRLVYGIDHIQSRVGDYLDIDKVTQDLEQLKLRNDSTYENVELEVIPISDGSISIVFEMQKKRAIKRVLIEFLEEDIKNKFFKKTHSKRDNGFISKLHFLLNIKKFLKVKYC